MKAVTKFNFNLPGVLHEQLSALADECGVSVADLIREGIGLVLNEAADARATGLPTLAILAPLARPHQPDSD